ncbi:MAG: NAD-dependent epimerase/dehydratase family protein [Gammaproteobacteria bacterium]
MTRQSILVTGATGLVGSNLCIIARGQGRRVRALVRSRADIEPLAAAGVEFADGDITDPPSLDRALAGIDGIVHCAAQIGGSWSKATPEDFKRTNQDGAINVLAAAERAGNVRTVMLSTPVVFSADETLTEDSRVQPIGPQHSPYTRAKIAAFYETMARAARGQDALTVIPGAIYGPAPLVDRALVPTSFNAPLLLAARGEIKRYLGSQTSWGLATDVARISLAALDKGEIGQRYLALGRPEDVDTFPGIWNRFCAMAGSPHRVEAFNPSAPGAADDKEFGTMLKYLRTSYPIPLLDCSRTTTALGVAPTPLEDGLRETLAWMRAHGKI